MPVEVDESPLPGENPEDYVLRLALSKAGAAAHHAAGDAIVIGSDTAVVDGRAILGKPLDAFDAESMLRRLRGRVHQVYTALAIVCNADGKIVTDCCVTDVQMRHYTDDEMQAYIQTGDPLDKAGAYAIQHNGFRPVETIQGCFANVMGLPLCYLVRLLDPLGIKPGGDVPFACQSQLENACSIYPLVLPQAD